jgi:hypothetical protein
VQEITIRLRFNQPCPGAVRTQDGKNVLHVHQRDPEGRVMFLASWWLALIRYAAQVLNKHQTEVKKISWDPVIDGVPRRWKRYLPSNPNKASRARYALHEAFLAGDVIGVNCVLPRAITTDDMWQLLEIAGSYKGISPYKPNEGFGTFCVVSIHKRRRTVGKPVDSQATAADTALED